LHKFGLNILILQTVLSTVVTFCVGTAFYNRLLKER